MEVKVLAPAKINLSLDVLSKRADGYHNISTVMQAVDLYDTITITDNESATVTISCNCATIQTFVQRRLTSSLIIAKRMLRAFISTLTRKFPHRQVLPAEAVTVRLLF